MADSMRRTFTFMNDLEFSGANFDLSLRSKACYVDGV